MIDRRDKKPIRAYILALTDSQLAYLREESGREHRRRVLEVRERRRRAKVVTGAQCPRYGQAKITGVATGSRNWLTRESVHPEQQSSTVVAGGEN